MIFLFPPEISAEKEMEDWEPLSPLLQSFAHVFIFLLQSFVSVLRSKSLLFLYSIILNADAVKNSFTVGHIQVAPFMKSFQF